MADDLPQQPNHRSERRVWRNTTWAVGVGVVGLLSSVAVMLGTDQGSQFLLNRVLANQNMVSYQYVGGNLYQGIQIKDLWVNLKTVDVRADYADIYLGWRAILNKEIHLHDGDVKNLKIITKTKPNGQPFSYPRIALPFTLRVDELKVDHLLIQTGAGTQVRFHQVQLEDTLWQDTKLQFAHTYGKMGKTAEQHYLAIKDASGFIDFDQKYPLAVVGKINLPSLHKSVKMQDIAVNAHGSLDQVHAGVATHHPDLVSGWVVARPMLKDVPMKGLVRFKNYHWPFITTPKMYSRVGTIGFQGDIQGFNLTANTDLKGEQIPQGQYHAEAYTDFVHGMDIHQLQAKVLQGQLDLAGRLGWDQYFSWQANGRARGIQAKDSALPQALQDFLPQNLDGSLSSTGDLKHGIDLSAAIDFDRAERWQLDLNQAPSKNPKQPQPMRLQLAWQGIDRTVPYVGWLKSAQGQADIRLQQGQQDIEVATDITQNKDSLLPTGHYQAKLNLKDSRLKVNQFAYQAGNSQLTGQADILLPSDKQQLQWSAQLNPQQFNLKTIVPASPVEQLSGQVSASGYAKPNQHIIQLKHVNLQAAAPAYQQQLRLIGQGTVAALFHEPKQGGGFKSFAVNYDGRLDDARSQLANGQLKLRLAGTPELIRIDDFQHRGALGRASVNGLVYLKDQVAWKAKVALIGFKSGYFYGQRQDEMTGYVDTVGQWGSSRKFIQLNNLNLNGRVYGQALRAQGQLNLGFGAQGTGLPNQFSAQNLRVTYAQNHIYANGNQNNAQLSIHAPNLNLIDPKLTGRIQGTVNVQSKGRLNAQANLMAYDLAYADQFGIKSMQLKGSLPTSDQTSTQMQAVLRGLRYGNRHLEQATALLAGTYRQHQLSLDLQNKNRSQFSLQLAGGFNGQNDWVGQLRQGQLKMRRIALQQAHVTPLHFYRQRQALSIGAHCWQSLIEGQARGRVCLNQTAEISAQKGNVSLVSQNIQLGDFAPFMPEGLSLTGQLNGYAKAEWAKGQKPSIDAQLLTTNGKVGVAGDDPNDAASTLSYQKVLLSAKSAAQGLQLNLDVNAEGGKGYAHVLVDPWSAQKTMRGGMAFENIQLKIFKPFISDARSLAGQLSFAGNVAGTLQKPQISGKLRLKDGAISMLSLPVNLHNIQLSSNISQNNATIEGGFNSGQGAGQLKGNVNWANRLNLKLNLSGKELYIRQAPLISALITPNINLDVTPSLRELKLNGQVNVVRAIVSMPQASATVVNTSADVRVVRNHQIQVLKRSQPWKITSQIGVNIGLDKDSKPLPGSLIVFKGFNTQIPFLGRLTLNQVGSELGMRANGAIGVTQTKKIEAYGQSLDLKRAIARFNGALARPNLDVDVSKNVQGNLVGFTVTGTANSPNIRIYNDAGLSEQEALNALITGRINEGVGGISQADGFRSDVNNTIAAAGISLGLGGTRALTNQIGRTFGLSGLALDAEGTGDDTQVNLTGYITPDLYVRYGVGVFTPVNKLTLRYQINKRMYLEASQALERSIDFFYNWKF